MKNKLLLVLLFAFTANLSAQVDTVPPTMLCKPSITANLFPGLGTISFFAGTDFYDTIYDNTSANIELGIRKACTGTGFPTDTFVTYYSPGSYWVELWAKDASGNSSMCEIQVIITDNWGSWHGSPLAFYSRTVDGAGIYPVSIEYQSFHCKNDSINLSLETKAPHGQAEQFYYGPAEPGSTYTIKASKDDDPLNGVTTYDLVLISKHILGIAALDSPYKLVAADANMDGAVTIADIVLLRKLLLGIIQELPHGKSWRFLPKNYVFPNAQDPFHPMFPESIVVPDVPDPNFSHGGVLTGVKIGDVNKSAVPGN